MALLGTAWLQTGRFSAGPTPLALAVWTYTAWTVASTAFLSPYYNPAGVFDAMFLLAGFSLGRALDEFARTKVFTLLASAIAALAVWAVLQVAFGWPRGQAFLETPNTLASVLNLALAPATVLVALGVERRALGWLLSVLFAGLCATLSRGGAIALATGLAVTLALFKGQRLGLRQTSKLIAFFVVGGLLMIAASQSSNWLPHLGSPTSAPPTADSLTSRFELYRLAWDAIDPRLWYGLGYLAFRFVLEAGRARAPSYGEDSVTYFVHDDYLQTLLEVGIVGFIALSLIVVLPLIGARRQEGARDQRCAVAAGLAAVVTTAVHAIGDFPLHVPICLLLFGMFIGTLDRLAVAPTQIVPRWRTASARLTQILIAAGLVTLLARPVTAEAAAAYGMHNWKTGDAQAAAYGLELARRLDSHDWRYHLYAGQFWFAQAAQSGTSDAATRAEQAFAAGIAANPLETSNRLGRVATHIRFHAVLPAPADAMTLRAWADAALALAPTHPAVRREYTEILRALEQRH